MSKKLFGKFFIFLLVVGLLFAVAPTRQAQAQTPSVWDGIYPTSAPSDLPAVVDGVQQVTTAAQFAWLASQTNMFPTGVTTVKLMVDINLNNHSWTPSGGLASGSAATGNIFDGNGHTISKLNADQKLIGADNFSALFVGDNGGAPIVKDLVIDGATVEATGAHSFAAVVVAANDFGGDFINITVKNATVKATKYAGGISTYSSSYDGGANFTNCAVEGLTIEVQEMLAGTAVDKPHVGGILGYMNEGKFSGNTVKDLTITVHPVAGQPVATERVGVLIGTAQANVLVGTYDISNVTYNTAPYTKLIGLDQRTYKVVNATQMLGYTTIQAAIDAAANGDVIEVGAGTYAELLTVNKSITLQGPNAAVAGDGTREEEAVITFPDGLTEILNKLLTVESDGVTVAGLKFQDKEYIQPLYPIHIYTLNANGLTIKNNLFIGGEQPIYRDPYVNTTNPDNTGWLIENNKFVGGPFVNSEYARAMYIYKTGATIQNNVIEGYAVGIQILPATAAVGGEVKNNTIAAGHIGLYHNGHDKGAGAWSYSGNTITVAPNNRAANQGIYDPIDVGQTVNFRAIQISNFGQGGTGDLPTVTFSNNVADLQPEATSSLADRIAVRLNLTSAEGTTVTVEKNSFVNYTVAVRNETVTAVDASPNWWGGIVGPQGEITAGVVYSPWCANADCETFAPDVDGNVYLSGPISGTGGILIGTPGLTYHLAADTVIQNNSPCFVIEASNTIIEAEPGAKCIPTGGSNGIDVAAGLNNITIDGLEIDGTGQTTGDGIHFAGAVSNIVLVDNNIHDLGSDGIEFAGDVSEVVEIQGNMFKGNLGLGINNLGANTVGAEYNSWGNVAGPAAGDGVSTKVTYEPFTHADLYVVSSGTPWANQVVTGQNITYTVMANLVNVNAADFYLEYPTNLTYVSHTDANALGINDEVTHDSATRKLHFIGYSTTGNKTGDLALFSVTFTANSTVLDAPLSFSYAATSGFGMVGYESSSNVFVNEMVNGSVTIVTLPTITSTDIQGYYLTGEQRQFSVVLNNPTGGADYAHVYVDYKLTGASLAQISLLEYSVDGGTTWVALGVGPGTTYGEDGLGNVVGYFGKIDGGGFPLAPGASLPTLFRVTFVTREQGATDFPTSYAVSMQLRDADALPDSYLLDELTDTMYVYDPATVTIAGDQYYIVDEPGAFTVTINNPTTGKNYDNTVVFDIVIADHVPADISALSCSMSGYTWDLLSSLTAVGSDVVARIEGADGFFTVPPTGVNMVVSCSVTYATAGNYVTSGEMVDVFDAVTPQERVVSTNISATAIVYTAPVITATFPTGPYVAGEPVTVPISITNPSGIPGPFSLVLNLPAGTTIVYNGVTYTCTDAGCPAIPVTLPIPTADLIITFPEGWTGDISMNLYDTSWDPDRLLATFTKTGVTVLGAFDVNGTVSMQGRSARAGVPLTLTGTSGTYNTTSTSLISNNYVFEDVAEGTYTFTTNQPRYLNITADLGKTVTLKGAKTLSSLWLRGGNAVYTDNEVNDTDLGKVSLGYTEGITTHPDADVNFDNKINIQDLALVGGNYLLTSDDAYADWQP